MARAKHTKAEKRDRSAERARTRKTILHYMTGPGSEDTWPVVQSVVHELFTNRQDILHDYVSTAGATDWVWLEENMSRTMEDSPNLMELAAAAHRIPHAERTAWDRSEYNLSYVACMFLALGVIRTVHPLVKHPMWMTDYIIALWGKAPAPDDTAEIARDMFLHGRDQEALALRGELAGEGPFMLFDSGFFQTGHFPPGIKVALHPDTTFTINRRGMTAHNDPEPFFGEDGLGVEEAIGHAVMAFGLRPDLTFYVECNTHHRDAWDNVIVFAISGDASQIAAIEHEKLHG